MDAILDEKPGNGFLEDFLQAQELLANFGAMSSLFRVLLKIASPDVPGFYKDRPGTGVDRPVFMS